MYGFIDATNKTSNDLSSSLMIGAMTVAVAEKSWFESYVLKGETEINVDKWSVWHIQWLYVFRITKNSQIAETIFNQK